MSVNVVDELYNELDFSQDKMQELELRIENIERALSLLLKVVKIMLDSDTIKRIGSTSGGLSFPLSRPAPSSPRTWESVGWERGKHAPLFCSHWTPPFAVFRNTT
jgi:hypothetical protein